MNRMAAHLSSLQVNSLFSKGSRSFQSCRIKKKKKFWNKLVVQRSEEHTSELQSHSDLVCRLLLEKKKKTK